MDLMTGVAWVATAVAQVSIFVKGSCYMALSGSCCNIGVPPTAMQSRTGRKPVPRSGEASRQDECRCIGMTLEDAWATSRGCIPMFPLTTEFRISWRNNAKYSHISWITWNIPMWVGSALTALSWHTWYVGLALCKALRLQQERS